MKIHIPRFLFLFLLATLFYPFCGRAQSGNYLKVLQFNIWQEGTMVKGGFEAIANEIIHSGAQVVTLSEVRNYHDSRFYERIIAALQKRGQTWYSFYSYDTGILSRFPIESSAAVYPEKNDHGSLYKIAVSIDGRPFTIYTTHLDYLNAANYLPRGYDGNTWQKLPGGKVASVDSVLQSNAASFREAIIDTFLLDAAKEKAKGRMVILGGDFNEPSFRDWTKATRNKYDHNGLIIPWPVTRSLEKHQFIDAYRKKYPDPVTHPGFTFPANNENIELKKLVWAAEADERDRIDFIFYAKDHRLQLKDCYILGPVGDIVKGLREEEKTKDKIIQPIGVWPTDHKAVVALFQIK